jgi:hypothetical protein
LVAFCSKQVTLINSRIYENVRVTNRPAGGESTTQNVETDTNETAFKGVKNA